MSKKSVVGHWGHRRTDLHIDEANDKFTITTVQEKIHSFLSVILVTSRSIRFSEKCLEMLRNERFSACLIALQR